MESLSFQFSLCTDDDLKYDYVLFNNKPTLKLEFSKNKTQRGAAKLTSAHRKRSRGREVYLFRIQYYEFHSKTNGFTHLSHKYSL